MLNKVINKLNGSGENPVALEAAILKLGRDREQTLAKIDELNKRRHQALLDDASDADLDKLEREIDRATVRLEKLTVAEPPLLEKLSAARTLARQRRWTKLRDAYFAAAAEFLAAARTAAQKHDAVGAIRAQAQREGFEGEAVALPPTPHVNGHALLAADLLDRFGRAIAPRSDEISIPITAAAAPRPTVPARLAHQRAPHGELLALVPERHAMSEVAPPLPDETRPLAPQEVYARVMHGGFPGSDGYASQRGRIVIGLEPNAVAAARHGRIEIIGRELPNTAAAAAPTDTDSPAPAA